MTDAIDLLEDPEPGDTGDAQSRLEAAGIWRADLEITPFGWLETLAPPAALENLHAFRLIDTESTPPRGHGWRNWQPVLIGDDDILMGPSPAMLHRILLTVGYFDRPAEFGQQLLLQFHRFALDFYDGHQVREQSFETDDGTLIVEGVATRAGREGTFRTVAAGDGVEFTANVNTHG